MAALETRILTEILRSGSMDLTLQLGLKEGHFKDPESRAIFNLLMRHWHNRHTASTLPSISSVQHKFPAFQMTAKEIEDPNERAPLQALVKQLMMSAFESDLRSMVSYFQDLVDQDQDSIETVKAMQAHLSELSAMQTSGERMGLRGVIERAIAHYDLAYTGQIYGLSWPWKCLTEDTLGKRSGKLIVFYARMKQMKTWVMLFNAVHDFLKNNARVLVWSKEMDKDDMALRVASILAKVDYQLFKKGKLPPKVYDRACRILEQYLDEDISSYDEAKGVEDVSRRKLILLCGKDAPSTLDELKYEITQYAADIAYLDSFYHMTTSRMVGVTQRWRQIAILSEDIKAMADLLGIPFVCIHQANRSGEKTYGDTMSDMADSDVLAREADLIIRILKRRGKQLYEEDYEVELERDKREAAALKAEQPKIGKPTIRIPRKVEEAIRQTEEDRSEDPLGDAIEDAESDEDDSEIPRTGAELALVLGGNREGVLNAFTIHAVPGYNFEFISSDYSLSDIKQWIKEDDEKDDVAAPKKPGGMKKPDFTSETFKNFRKGGS